MGLKDALANVLAEAGEPLHSKELTRRRLRRIRMLGGPRKPQGIGIEGSAPGRAPVKESPDADGRRFSS